jgi:Sulfotransferase family
MEPKPVIILGAARSGTKILREIIATSEVCCAVPFDVNFLWRSGNEESPHDALDPASCQPSTSRFIRKKLLQMSGALKEEGCQYVIEKTVSNTMRVPFIRTALPDALYIHLIRDGREVIESSWRMWHAPVERKYLMRKLRYLPLRNLPYAFWYIRNMIIGRLKGSRGVQLWGVRYPGIENDLKSLSILEVCARQWQSSVDAVGQAWDSIPESNKLEVRYEKLAIDSGEISKICDFLELPDKQSVIDHFLDSFKKPNRPGSLSALDPDEWKRAMTIIGPAMKRYDY